MYDEIIAFIRSLYPGRNRISLHEPVFIGREKDYVNSAIDSTFVSSVGEFVNRFEDMICALTGAAFAVATVSGTAALHVALKLAGVQAGDEVITQPVTFVATANAIAYCGAEPVFLDVERDTMGLSPDAFEGFMGKHAVLKSGGCFNQKTGKRIAACVPMHTFGHPCRMDAIKDICGHYRLALVEDAAESLGSIYKGRHTGTFGDLGIYSFNGNKIVTCGGGGMIVTDSKELAIRARHITTTAKLPHAYRYEHDMIGYNYRLPNLNAALACAQLEKLNVFLENKRDLAERYRAFFENSDFVFAREPKHARSNYWLNALVMPDCKARDNFLDATHQAGVMTRPVWKRTNSLAMYRHCQHDDLKNAEWLEGRIVNIPSSVRI